MNSNLSNHPTNPSAPPPIGESLTTNPMKTLFVTLVLALGLASALATDLSNVTILGFKPGDSMSEANKNPIIAGKPFKTTLDFEIAKKLGFDYANPGDMTAEQLPVYLKECLPKTVNGALYPTPGAVAYIPYQVYKFTENYPQLLGLPIEELRLFFSYSIKQNERFLVNVTAKVKVPDVPIDPQELAQKITDAISKNIGKPGDNRNGEAAWWELIQLPKNGSRIDRRLHVTTRHMEISLSWENLGGKYRDEVYQEADRILHENKPYNPEGILK